MSELTSTSEWGSPVLFVCKPDASLHFCINFYMFNKATVHGGYPLPRHEDLFNMLGSVCYFSSLDLRSGCWQVHIADSDIYKTAF